MAARAEHFTQSFTGGELGPEGWERTDLVQHARGCEEALNLLIAVTGPLVSRGGFLDKGAVKIEGAEAILAPFRRSVEDALFLELGDGYGRVRTVLGELVMDGPSPVEFVTPWAASELGQLWFRQVGDVVFVTRLDAGRTHVIQRLTAVSWQVVEFDWREGPWLVENTDTALTVTASGATGAGVTLTASAALFSESDEGALLRIRAGDGSPGYYTWTSQTTFTPAAIVQYDGKVYLRNDTSTGLFGNQKSGTTPPVHSSGVLSDGFLDWEFLHDGAGVFRIDTYVSPTQVTGTVVSRLPTTSATRYWARQGYSDALGWPRALAAEREDRLAFAASLSQPARMDMTRTAGFGPGYGDFKPGLGTGRVVDDDAVKLTVGGAGARIVWIENAVYLTVGTTEGEYVVTGPRLDDQIVPNVPICRPLSAWGSADVPPLVLQGPPPTIVHIDRTRKVVRELKLGADQASSHRELSLLASHIFDRGVAQMVSQRPENIIWFRLDDGGLAAMTYHQEHEVLGSTRMGLPEGWTCESLAAAPGTDGRDEVMGVFTRDKAGTRQRRVWRLSRRTEQVFLDGAVAQAGAVTALTGLDAWEGEQVTVVVDGALLGERTVTGGQVTGLAAETGAAAGAVLTRRFVSLPGDLQGVGSTHSRLMTPTEAVVTLDCAEAWVKVADGQGRARVSSREPGDLTAPGRRRLRERVTLNAGAGRDKRVEVGCDGPFDLTIHAIRWNAGVSP